MTDRTKANLKGFGNFVLALYMAAVWAWGQASLIRDLIHWWDEDPPVLPALPPLPSDAWDYPNWYPPAPAPEPTTNHHERRI